MSRDKQWTGPLRQASRTTDFCRAAACGFGIPVGDSEAEEEQYKEGEEAEWATASDTARGGNAGCKADACGFGGHTTGCSAVPIAVRNSDASFLLQLIPCPITKVSIVDAVLLCVARQL